MMMMMMMILLLFREEDLLRKINKSSSLSGIERSCNRRILGCLVGYQHRVLRNKYLPVASTNNTNNTNNNYYV